MGYMLISLNIYHIEAQSEDVTNHTNSNHSNSSIPENKATTESSSKPKKEKIIRYK